MTWSLWVAIRSTSRIWTYANAYIICTYWNCIFRLNPHLRLLVGWFWLVNSLFGRSVWHNFLKRARKILNGSYIGALLCFLETLSVLSSLILFLLSSEFRGVWLQNFARKNSCVCWLCSCCVVVFCCIKSNTNKNFY